MPAKKHRYKAKKPPAAKKIVKSTKRHPIASAAATKAARSPIHSTSKGNSNATKGKTNAEDSKPTTKPKQPSYTPLTPAQLIFCAEYVKDMDGKRAAIAAGVDPLQATQTSSRWLRAARFPLIAEEIERLARLRQEECGIDTKRIIVELTRIGLFNPKRMLDADGVILPLQRMPDDVACCIQSMEVTTVKEKGKGGRTKNLPKITKIDIRFWNKLEALKQLATHLLLGSDKDPTEGKGKGLPVIDWTNLYGRGAITVHTPPAQLPPDPIEQKIKALEEGIELVPASVANDIGDGPKGNGGVITNVPASQFNVAVKGKGVESGLPAGIDGNIPPIPKNAIPVTEQPGA